MPLVSIVTPVFNMERFLAEAVASVQAQSLEDWELLLVDDGSRDGSAELAGSYADSRIRCLHHPGRENRGISATRNLGLSQARGEFLAFLDADDVWMPAKLERQLEMLDRHPQADLVWGTSLYWGSWNGQPDHVPALGLPAHRPLPPGTCLRRCYPLGRSASPCTSCLLLRRRALAWGGFDESFRGRYELFEDQSLFMKLFLNGTVVTSHELWCRYRLHADSCCARNEVNETVSWAFFLGWLERYLRARKVRDPRVWAAFCKARLKTRIRLLLGR